MSYLFVIQCMTSILFNTEPIVWIEQLGHFPSVIFMKILAQKIRIAKDLAKIYNRISIEIDSPALVTQNRILLNRVIKNGVV